MHGGRHTTSASVAVGTRLMRRQTARGSVALKRPSIRSFLSFTSYSASRVHDSESTTPLGPQIKSLRSENERNVHQRSVYSHNIATNVVFNGNVSANTYEMTFNMSRYSIQFRIRRGVYSPLPGNQAGN